MLPPVPRQVSFRPTGWAAAGATRGRSSRGRRHQKGTLIQYQVRWGCSKEYMRRVEGIFVSCIHSSVPSPWRPVRQLLRFPLHGRPCRYISPGTKVTS